MRAFTALMRSAGSEACRTCTSALDVRTLGYDHRNRLVEVKDYNGDEITGTLVQSVEYAYDAFNRRVSRSEDSDGDGSSDVDEKYVYDGDDVIFDFAGDGATNEPVRRYLHGNAVDQVFAQENTAEISGAADRVYWFAGDNQQTTRDLLTRTGAVKEHYQLKPPVHSTRTGVVNTPSTCQVVSPKLPLGRSSP